MIRQTDTNEFTTNSVLDLFSKDVTDLYNTGRLNDRYTVDHAGAATILVPQASVFTDTYVGQEIELGSFKAVQDILKGTFNSFFEPGRTYTVGELQEIDAFRGIGWNFSVEHGAVSPASPRYVDFAYILGTQNFTVDPATEVIVDAQGNASFGQYEVRLNIRPGDQLPTEDFDFEGGGWGSDVFNFLISDDIDCGGRPVRLQFTGSGLTGEGYSRENLDDYIVAGGVEGGGIDTISLARKAIVFQTTIIPELEQLGVINRGDGEYEERWLIPLATKPQLLAIIAKNTKDQPDFLRIEGNLEKLVDAFGVSLVDDYLRDPTDFCFLPHTPITLADGTMRAIEAIRPGDTVLSYAADGTLTPARVTRTFVNEAACVLDFHGTGVTPGHVFLCGASRFAGRHVPLIDTLRDDSAVVWWGGSLMQRPECLREGEGTSLTPGAASPMGLLAQGPAPAMRGGARCVA